MYGEINGMIESDKHADEFISFMSKNADIFRQQDNDDMRRGYEKFNFKIYEYYDIQHALISDSLVITYKHKELNTEISRYNN